MIPEVAKILKIVIVGLWVRQEDTQSTHVASITDRTAMAELKKLEN